MKVDIPLTLMED